MMLRVIVEIGPVGLACKAIPFAGEDAVPAYGLKTKAQAANAGKQVDEAEPVRGL